MNGKNIHPLLFLCVPAVLSQDDGSYSWTDGWPVFFTQWGPGEPTNIQGEGCVSMRVSPAFYGTWNDTKCNLQKPFICKISSGMEPTETGLSSLLFPHSLSLSFLLKQDV